MLFDDRKVVFWKGHSSFEEFEAEIGMICEEFLITGREYFDVVLFTRDYSDPDILEIAGQEQVLNFFIMEEMNRLKKR